MTSLANVKMNGTCDGMKFTDGIGLPYLTLLLYLVKIGTPRIGENAYEQGHYIPKRVY